MKNFEVTTNESSNSSGSSAPLLDNHNPNMITKISLIFLAISVFSMFLYLVIDSVGNNSKSSSSSTKSAPLPVESWVDKKLMFIYPHTDDMVASAGGLAYALSAQSTEVFALVITNGDKGCGNEGVCGNKTNEELADIRVQEQINAGAILNIPQENFFFLGYEDCEMKLASRVNISKDIVTNIRSYKPDIVMTWDPAPHFNMIPSEGWDDMGYHPDHQYTGELTIDSIWYAHLDRMWTDLGDPWRVAYLYQWAFNPGVVPSHYFDITGTPYEKKSEAMLENESQYTYIVEITDFLEFLNTQVAVNCNVLSNSIKYAEGFTYIYW